MSALPKPNSHGKALPAIAVGGGLAGAAFAFELARNGHRVVVLERTRGPHHKVCGEFLSEEAQTLLRDCGVNVHALGATTIARFRLANGERQATCALPFLAAGISRFRLDEALLAAAERAGAVVVRGAQVTGIAPGDDAILVRTAGHTWRASAVALATGKHSLRGLRRPPGRMVGFKIHLEPMAAVRDLAGAVQLVFFRGGYVGACLIEQGILSIGWVMQNQLMRFVGPNWPAQSSHLARQSSLIGDLIQGTRPLFDKPVATASIPYGYICAQSVAPHVFPIGDQLGVVPSFTGDGMALALHTGWEAARAILAGHPAAEYQRDVVARLRRQFRIARGLGLLLETTATSHFMVRAAGVLPSLATKLAAVTRFKRADM